MAGDEAGGRAVPLVLVGLEDTPIQYANNFVVQFDDTAFILTIGQFGPPMLLGDEAEQRAQAEQITHVPVKVLARVAMTRARLTALISVLQKNLESADRVAQARQAKGDGDRGE
jgi:hypothetical protein